MGCGCGAAWSATPWRAGDNLSLLLGFIGYRVLREDFPEQFRVNSKLNFLIEAIWPMWIHWITWVIANNGSTPFIHVQRDTNHWLHQAKPGSSDRLACRFGAEICAIAVSTWLLEVEFHLSRMTWHQSARRSNKVKFVGLNYFTYQPTLSCMGHFDRINLIVKYHLRVTSRDLTVIQIEWLYYRS